MTEKTHVAQQCDMQPSVKWMIRHALEILCFPFQCLYTYYVEYIPPYKAKSCSAGQKNYPSFMVSDISLLCSQLPSTNL
jgi:hypothetical protein